ncbi:MAG: hypothetical protein K0S74_617 [Chlamydiales bacterium]|jgi:D-alanyl-D-alanine dipeptidase|nr:hypothetical protein [Chlamydiales bacterium]
MRKWILPIFVMLIGLMIFKTYQDKSSNMPKEFTYLHEIEPSILSDLRYRSSDNFTGAPIVGYESSKIIVTRATAEALKAAQAKFKADGYSLIIYDAYRPQRAVNRFMQWSKDLNNQEMKAWFYPRVDKAKVFELGYVAEKSGHSRGSTVDVSLIRLDSQLKQIEPRTRTLNDGFQFFYLDDGTIDMGSSFDLFDKASHYENDLINQEYKDRRTYLKNVMESCGFKNYPEEWWHFTLRDEPFPDTYFDFLVK